MIAPAGFKSITVSEAVHTDAELVRLVERGKAALAEVLGESSPMVEVRWDVVRDDRDRAVVELTLRDWTGEVSTRFAAWEFENDARLLRRLYSLWGDLLQLQSRIRLREMQEAVNSLSVPEV
jgi:hypothetical protein